MKKKIIIISCLLLISSLAAFFFAACDKDTDCYVEVTVIDQNTNLPISGALVTIDIDNSYVSAEGYTNANGRFDAVFKAPAIFNVVARYETGYDDIYTPEEWYCYREGHNTIRLKEGEVVKTTVIVESTVHQEMRN